MSAPTATAPRTILLVDDDAQLRRMLTVKLTRLGHTVVEAADGRRAIEACRGGVRPDVVVTDIFMPEKDGLELIRLLAREFPSTPVVAMSGGSPRVPEDYLPHAALFGAMVTLAKPFRTDDLIAAIDRAIGQGSVFPSFDAAPAADAERAGPAA